ncbi:hypothetical protein AQ974_10655 [Acinetobacter baumannii]|nr:hypothetical protein MRSN16897_10805 [Acinetobacter baumannii]KKD27931.1 hypothetical protein MRSN16875_10720 [Acinetobacter baumannii]KRR71352.1 hypothetical protein AQ974_10655 [Acinetobacter baumannii]KRR73535.1 hypothetical protein AQ976_09825 [Acinetobacter baumannii]KRR83696.1 hypothetical protein AR272_10725 [Acinetobacter baumannii]
MQHTWFRFVIWWDEVISVAPKCFKSSPNGGLFLLFNIANLKCNKLLYILIFKIKIPVFSVVGYIVLGQYIFII